MRSTRKWLCLLLSLAMAVGLMGGLSLGVRATVRQSTQTITLTYGQEPKTAAERYFEFGDAQPSGTYFDRCTLSSGRLPDGLKWTSGEVDPPHIYDAPRELGTFKTIWIIDLSNGDNIRHDLTIVVKPTKTYTASQSITLRQNKALSGTEGYFDIDKYLGTYGWAGCKLASGKLPEGVSYSWGEGNTPHLIGTPAAIGSCERMEERG